jgi:hypothetical protein
MKLSFNIISAENKTNNFPIYNYKQPSESSANLSTVSHANGKMKSESSDYDLVQVKNLTKKK